MKVNVCKKLSGMNIINVLSLGESPMLHAHGYIRTCMYKQLCVLSKLVELVHLSYRDEVFVDFLLQTHVVT